MKKLLFGTMMIISTFPALAVTAEDIRAGQAELNRACTNGSSSECAEAGRVTRANADQLNRDIYHSIEQRDQERQAVQRDEQWRQQIRNQNR